MKKIIFNNNAEKDSAGALINSNCIDNKECIENVVISSGEKIVQVENLQETIDKLLAREAELKKENMELSMAQSRLLELNRNLTELFDLAPLGCFILDENDTIIKVNYTGGELLGWKKNN